MQPLPVDFLIAMMKVKPCFSIINFFIVDGGSYECIYRMYLIGTL